MVFRQQQNYLTIWMQQFPQRLKETQSSRRQHMITHRFEVEPVPCFQVRFIRGLANAHLLSASLTDRPLDSGMVPGVPEAEFIWARGQLYDVGAAPSKPYQV